MIKSIRAIRRLIAQTEDLTEAVTFKQYKKLHPKTKKTKDDPMFFKKTKKSRKIEKHLKKHGPAKISDWGSHTFVTKKGENEPVPMTPEERQEHAERIRKLKEDW